MPPAAPRYLWPRVELLENRCLLTTDVLIEDFQFDSNPTQPGFASSVFHHSRPDSCVFSAGPCIQDYGAGFGGAPTSSPYGLVEFDSHTSDVITFPGLEVDFVSVAVNSYYQWGGGTAAVQFVGVNGTACYRPPSGASFFPRLDPQGWLPCTVELPLLPEPGNPDWVIIDSDPHGLVIGPFTEVRLGGDTVFFDDLTIHAFVPPPNEPPVAVDDEAIMDIGQVDIDVLNNDRDPDGDPLTIAQVADPPHGTAMVNGSLITYVPDVGFHGSDAFDYTVDDGRSGTATATVVVTVTLGRLVFTEDFSDDDNPSLPSFDNSGVFQHNINGNYSITEFSGNQKLFLFGATDQITITRGVNESVDFARVDVSAYGEGSVSFVGQNGTFSVPFLAQPDPSPFLRLTGNRANEFTVSAAAGYILPSGLELGSIQRIDLFGYEVAFDRVMVLIVDAQPNQPPAAVDDTALTPPGEAVVINVLANDSDPEGDRLLIPAQVLTPNQGGTAAFVDTLRGVIEYTPVAGFRGVETFAYTVLDDEGNSATATVSVTVNTPPNTHSDEYVFPHGYAGIFAVDIEDSILTNDSDLDGDPIRADLLTQPSYGTIELSFDGTFVYRPTAPDGRMYNDSFSYQLADGHWTRSSTVRLLADMNQAPVASEGNIFNFAHDVIGQTISRNLFSPAVLATDSDRDPLHVVTYSQPEHGRLQIDPDGTFHYEPIVPVLHDSFTFVVSDGYERSGPGSLELVWENIAPVAHPSSETLWIDDPFITIDAVGHDHDNDSFTAIVESQPEYGAVVFNQVEKTFTYTPFIVGQVFPGAQRFQFLPGYDHFQFRLFDGFEYSNLATVVIEQYLGKGIARSDSYVFAADDNTDHSGYLHVGASNGLLANDTIEGHHGTVYPASQFVTEVTARDFISYVRGCEVLQPECPVGTDGSFDYFASSLFLQHAEDTMSFSYRFRYQGYPSHDVDEFSYLPVDVFILEHDASVSQSDADGIRDPDEDAAPNGGDMNQDGIPDRNQPEVASLPNEVDGAYVSFVSSPGTKLFDVSSLGHDDQRFGQDPGPYRLPLGVFEFTVTGLAPGESTTVTMILPTGIEPTTYYKFGYNPRTFRTQRYEFLFDPSACAADPRDCTGAETHAQNALIPPNQIVLHFVDGWRGDTDGQINGVITDPGGPGYVIPELAISGPMSINEADQCALALTASGHGSELVTGWTITWGDGTTSMVSGSQTTAEHRYADGPRAYSVSATATIGNLAFPADNTIDVMVLNVAPTATFRSNGTVPAGAHAAVSFSNPFDPSTEDTTAGFLYSFDFNNDGDFDDISDLNGVATASASVPIQPPGTYLAHGRITDKDGGSTDYLTDYRVLPGSGIHSVVINDGSAQRSMVSSITITFDGRVKLGDGALELRESGVKQSLKLGVVVTVGESQTVALLTFKGPHVVVGSLEDGSYQLIIHGGKIRDASGRLLDADADGKPGGDAVDEFFRLFGDTDGDRDVDALDKAVFDKAYGKRSSQTGYLWYLDYNANGRIWSEDLALFLKNHGRCNRRR
jgi:hypothetical protein